MPYREGFALAGAWLIEHEKDVAYYPAEGANARIRAERQHVGGEAFGLASALRTHEAALSLYALGAVGEDEDGHAILHACHQLEIDTYQLQALTEAATAHAHVIISGQNGGRTSFYFGGANDALGLAQFDFRHCLARWFHLGDLPLLALMAQPDEEFGALAGRVLHLARMAGLATSLSWAAPAGDLDEEARARIFAQTDYLILSAEALPALTGVVSDRDATPSRQAWEAAAQQILSQGVNRGVMIHSEEICRSYLRQAEMFGHELSTRAGASNSVLDWGADGPAARLAPGPVINWRAAA